MILWRSLLIAVKTTIICLLLGYPAAYFISRCSERAQNILILCVTIPMWINMLVRTYAWIGLLKRGRDRTADPFPDRTGEHRASVYGGSSSSRNGIQLPAVYDPADADISLARWTIRFWKPVRIWGQVRHRLSGE